MSKTFLVTGATGLIGSSMVKELLKSGNNAILISTNPEKAAKKFPMAKLVDWDSYLSLVNEKIDVIINLAGRNAGDKRWNEDFKNEIYNSRILSTRKIIELVSLMKQKPEALINASGIDYYGNKGDENIYEDSPPGNDFMAKVCIDWETEAKKAEAFGVRVVLVRTGFVLAKNSEALERLILPFKFFAGGTIGNGNQFISWIHADDIIGIYLFATENSNVKGAVNAAAPHPERMRNFCRILGKVLQRPAFLPAPAFVVKLVAGEVAHLILNGRKAMPQKILEAGYKFKFENAHEALNDAIS